MRIFELPTIEILELDATDIMTVSHERVGWDLLSDDLDTTEE